MNQPSGGRKLAFWLLIGMISVVFVEVPAGSTMFPFFTVWGLLVAFLGFMQFINSPSVVKSFLSGAGNSLVLGVALFLWRRSGGAAYSMRELLPGTNGMKIFGSVLLVWYVFWGCAIKPKSIPGVINGQLTVWVLYAVLLLVFIGALRQSRREATATGASLTGQPFVFTWRGFLMACAVATGVTTISRLLLFRFASLQILLFFSFYVVAGLVLFVGSLIYAGAFGGVLPRPGLARRTFGSVDK